MKNGEKRVFPERGYAAGLNKREYFAAVALQGLLAHHGDDDYPRESIAEYAVEHADLLLKELDK